MNLVLISFLCIILIALPSSSALALSQNDFEKYMDLWTQKRELASQSLREAENAFKSGNKVTGCITQQHAGEYGIEATQFLIKAMQANGSIDGLESIEAGLNKWRELRDFC